MSILSTPNSGPGGAKKDETAETELPREQIFQILRNKRRQYILRYLVAEASGPQAEFRELVDQVAAWENDTTIERVDSASRKSVYTALRQSHLPKLDNVGIIEYDNQRGDIALTDTTQEVYLYLEYTPGGDISWSQYYLRLSSICSLLLAAAWLGIYPFVGVSGIVFAALFVGIFSLSSIVHVLHPLDW